jgi:hypothetical protein
MNHTPCTNIACRDSQPPQIGELIDVTERVALLLIAILLFITDEEGPRWPGLGQCRGGR